MQQTPLLSGAAGIFGCLYLIATLGLVVFFVMMAWRTMKAIESSAESLQRMARSRGGDTL